MPRRRLALAGAVVAACAVQLATCGSEPPDVDATAATPRRPTRAEPRPEAAEPNFLFATEEEWRVYARALQGP